MLKKFDLNTIGINLFAVWWALLITVGYLGYHEYYSKAFSTPYWPIILIIGGISAFSFWNSRKKKKPKPVHFRGVQILVIFQIIAIVILGYYCAVTDAGNSNLAQGLVYFGFNSFGYFLAVVFLLMSSFVIGRFSHRFLKLKESYQANLVYLALGISFLTTIGFILGYVGLFKNIILWPIIILCLIFNHKETIAAAKAIFLKKYSLTNDHWSIFPLIWIALIISAVLWISSLKVFPVGFDGSTLYMNNANLLASTFTLPTGGHAFNWSIFMATGLSLFNSETVGMLLAHSIGFMALYALFLIIRKWLPLHHALLAIVLVLISPYWSFLASFDEKIDLGLLFMISCAFLLFNTIITNKESVIKRDYTLWIVLGWLVGFCFGIKYTSLILIIAIIGQIFYSQVGFKGYILAILGLLGIMFGGGLAEFGYITLASGQSTILSISILLLGVLVYSALGGMKELKKLKTPIRITLLLILGLGINFLPWALKHQVEHATLSSVNILEGKNKAILPNGLQQSKSVGSINQSPKKNDFESSFKVIPVSFQETPIDKNTLDKDIQGWEDIIRYLGYEDHIWNYLSLPFDQSYNVNAYSSKALDVGYLFLIICPFLFILFLFKRSLLKIGLGVVLLLFTGLGLFNHHFVKSTGNFNGHESWISGHVPEWNSLLNSVYSVILIPISVCTPLLKTIYQWGSSVNIVFALLTVIGLFVSIAILLKNAYEIGHFL